MAKVIASLITALVPGSMAACCGGVVFKSDPANDGATVLVVSRECGGTTAPITSIFVDSEEILRMNADATTVSLRWENDGSMLIVSTPDDVSTLCRQAIAAARAPLAEGATRPMPWSAYRQCR